MNQNRLSPRSKRRAGGSFSLGLLKRWDVPVRGLDLGRQICGDGGWALAGLL